MSSVMRHLADANVFLALAIEDHAHHPDARRWFNDLCADDTAEFCRLTQNTLLRLLTNERLLQPYGLAALSNEEAIAAYRTFFRDSCVKFCPEPRGLEDAWFKLAARPSASPLLWMDAYLAAFAIVEGLRLVTFDRGFHQFADLELCLLSSP
jgi:toxin-antitoxin system PIN domain toxin